MTAALRYEWRRLWTIRSTYWLIGPTLVFQFIFTLIFASALDPLDDAYADYTGGQLVAVVVTAWASLGATPLISAYIVALLGVFSFAHEYRHGMIRTTLIAVPSRGAVLAAKTILTAGIAAALAFVCAMIGLANSALFLEGDLAANTGFVWEIILGLVVYTTLFSLCGLAVAGILRHQAGALALILLFPTMIEGILHVLLVIPEGEGGLNKVAAFLPFDAGGQMFARPLQDDILEIFGYEPLQPVAGGLVFGVFTVALLAIAGGLFFRRDA